MTPSLSLPRKRYEEEKAKYSIQYVTNQRWLSCQYLHFNPHPPPGYDIKRTFWNKIVQNFLSSIFN